MLQGAWSEKRFVGFREGCWLKARFLELLRWRRPEKQIEQLWLQRNEDTRTLGMLKIKADLISQVRFYV